MASVSEGQIHFRHDEVSFFDQIFTSLCHEDSLVHGIEGAEFLRSSGLADDQLHTIWDLSCGGISRPALNRSQFFVAMKLVAMAQHHIPLDWDHLVLSTDVPLPKFSRFSGPSSASGDGSLLNVTIPNAIQVGTFWSGHTEYTIVTRTNMAGYHGGREVKRRYKDFEFLHQQLTQQYKGYVIPPLPEKKFVGRMSSDFVEQRRQSLEQYLQALCSHSVFSQSEDLRTFLDAPDNEFTDLRSSDTADASYLSTSLGAVWTTFSYVQSRLSSASMEPLPFEEDEELTRAEAAVKAREGPGQQTVTAAQKLIKAQKDLAYRTTRVGQSWSELHQLEKNKKLEDLPNSRMSSLVGHCGSSLERAGELLQDCGDRDLTYLLEPFKAYARSVSAAQTAIAAREQLISDYQNSSLALKDKKARYAKARTNVAEAHKAHMLAAEVESSEKSLEQAGTELKQVSSTLKAQLALTQSERQVALRKALLTFAQSQVANAEQLRQHWAESLRILEQK